MYAQVVVLTYQPPKIDTYTYEIPKNLEKDLKPGMLVKVPFGIRNPMGIIISCHPERLAKDLDSSSATQNDKIVIKPISGVIFNQPILLPYQIKLLKWLTFYYHAPMVNCLEAILPELPSKLLIVNGKWNEIHSLKKSIHNSSLTIHQTLVLVPSINRLPETLAK